MTEVHKCRVKCRRMTVLVLSLFVVLPALADWTYDEQASWEYQVADGAATVTCIYPKSTTLNIPNSLGGYPVMCVAGEAFRGVGCEQLETICLPAGVRSMDEDRHVLFYWCDSLREISVSPDNEVYSSFDGVLYDKSKRVLMKCPRKKASVEIAQGAKHVDIWSFADCVNLTSVVLPSSVTSIGQGAFRGCRLLECVDIPDGVTNIENGAFYDCDSLSSVKIPQAMASIGPGAFSWCSGLLSIAIPESVESIGSGAFNSCGSLREVLISEGVKRLGLGAFGNCTNLTAVRIPSSVSYICGGAFEGCVELTEIKVDEENPSYQSLNGMLLDKSGTCLVTCPAGLGEFEWPEGLRYVDQRAFAGCRRLTSVHIPEGVERVCYRAFEDCDALTEVTIPSSVSWLDECFMGCSALMSFDVDLRNNCYRSQDGLLFDKSGESLLRCPEGGSSVVIPSTVKQLCGGSFVGCANVGEVEIPEGVIQLDGWVFDGCDNLTSLILPETLVDIGADTFSFCPNLRTVFCRALTPPSITTNDFRCCDCLRRIYVDPEEVEAYRDAWCEYADKILAWPDWGNGTVESPWLVGNDDERSVVAWTNGTGCLVVAGNGKMEDFRDTVNPMGWRMTPWSGCMASSVVISNGVTSVGAAAFCGEMALKRVEVAQTVTAVGSRAFADSGLESIVFVGNCPDEVGEGTFDGTSDDLTVYASAFAAGWPTNGVWQGRKLVLLYADWETCNVTTNTTSWHDDEGRLTMEWVHRREVSTRTHVEQGDARDFRVDDERYSDIYVMRYYDRDGLMTNEWLSSVGTGSEVRVYRDMSLLEFAVAYGGGVDRDEESGLGFSSSYCRTNRYNDAGLSTNVVEHNQSLGSDGVGERCDLEDDVRYDEMGRETFFEHMATWGYSGYADIADLIVEEKWRTNSSYDDFGFCEWHAVETIVYGDGTRSVRNMCDLPVADEHGRLVSDVNLDVTTNRWGEVEGQKVFVDCSYGAEESDECKVLTEEVHVLEDGRDAVTRTEIDYQDGKVIQAVACNWETGIGVDVSTCVSVVPDQVIEVSANSAQEAVDKTIVEYAIPMIPFWGNVGAQILDCASYRKYFSFDVTEIGAGLWRVTVVLDVEKIGMFESVCCLCSQLGKIASGAETVTIRSVPGLYYSLYGTDDLSEPWNEGPRILAEGETVTLRLPGQKKCSFYKIRVSVKSE